MKIVKESLKDKLVGKTYDEILNSLGGEDLEFIPSNKIPNGTYLKGKFNISYEKLVELFGHPNVGIDDTVWYEWVLEDEYGRIYTIYDRYAAMSPSRLKTFEWNLGGNKKSDIKSLKRYLLKKKMNESIGIKNESKLINKLINEADISSVKLEDIVNKETLNHWLMDSYLEELYQHGYAYEHNINPDDLPEDFLESEEFEKWVKYEMEINFENTVSKFENEIIGDNTIPIWRSIVVNKNWLNNLNNVKRLGIYWTWDKDAAEPHWGYDSDKIEVLLESEININYVDWIETIKLNMHPSYEEEKEIRLFKNTPIKLKSIEVNGEEIDLPSIKNKIFKA